MSFGYYDKDWVEPDDEQPIKCEDCDNYVACECGCGWGWCSDIGDFVKGEWEGC